MFCRLTRFHQEASIIAAGHNLDDAASVKQMLFNDG